MPDDSQENDATKSFVLLPKGTAVSHYTIIQKIGAGGMGEVYLAEDTKLQRKVALKFLPQHLVVNNDAKARFTREAQAAAALKHPNIITIYEVSEYQGRPFFAMECCEGQSLHDLIKEQKLNLDEIIGLTKQVCEGLQEAHEASIIHRDIKSSNVMLDKKGRPKLLDFGLAAVKGTDKLTKTGSTLGTIGYMSPEQARGEKVDQRSDIFSLGVVLYEMITGRRPFKGEDDVAILHAITHDTPEPLARYKADVPDELQKIVDLALEKNIETRYQTASGMLADLKRLAASERATVPAKKKARRLKWASAMSVLIVVAVLGGLGLKYWLAPAEAPVKSLAVVDFDNIGAEEDAYLASGLAEDLAVKLRKLKGFHVASSADIRRLVKENLLPREIAARLGVQYALGGSLLREDTLVRVNVELIDKKTGNVVWSDQIDWPLTEIFGFMDEVSQKIAQALEVRLTPVDKAALAAKPTDDAAAYDHYLKGRHYYYRVTFRDNELAEKEFQRALQIDPDYPLALAGLADTYVQHYKERFDYDEYWLDSSKVLIDRALVLDPNLAEAYESRAEVFLEEDNVTGAREAAEKARELRPDWDEPYIHLGNIYKNRGLRDTALAMFDTALSLRPSVDAWCGRGNILLTRGYMDSAKAAYLAAVKLNPDHDRPYLNLGRLYQYGLYEGEKAESLYQRAIEVRPDHAAGYEQLSHSLFNRGSVQEGEKLLRDFVERFPYNWDGYEALYEYLAWWKGDYPAAVKIVEEAVNRNPNRVWPHLLLAYSYAEKMSPEAKSDETPPVSEKAVQSVKRALALRPNSGRVLEWAGDVYTSLNHLEEAMEYYNRALEYRPGSSDLLYSIAMIFRKMRHYEKAAEFMRKAIEKSPGVALYYYDLRSVLVHDMNRWQEYFDIIQQATADYGDDPQFLSLLSTEQRVAGQYEEAIKTSRRALERMRIDYYLLRLGIALWLSGDVEGALALCREGKFYYESGRRIVAMLKSEGRFDEIEHYLDSIKTPIPGHYLSGIDFWAWLAGPYYMSMRRFDDALAAFREYRESGEETWSIDISMTMAECYRQKGEIDSARHILERLADTSTAAYRPLTLIKLALLEAIGAQDLTAAVQLAEKAQAEQNIPQDKVTEPVLRLQYASGKMDKAAKSLDQLVELFWPTTAAYYRRAQLSAATSSSEAARYLDEAVSSLTRLTRGGEQTDYSINASPPSFLALALARAGKPDEARQQVKRALKLEPERADIAYNAACAYSLLGDTALALQWLETAVERGCLELWWARVDPDLDPLRELPRFKENMNDWDRRIQAMLEKSGRD